MEQKPTCSSTCPGIGAFQKVPKFIQQGNIDSSIAACDGYGEFQSGGGDASMYEPGHIGPLQLPLRGPDDPPCYLPQEADQIPAKDLEMDPTGPWATGNTDWTPLAGLTGTRPVVDRYSLTRYSIGEWRKHNEDILNNGAIAKSNIVEYNGKNCMMQVFGKADKDQYENTRRLRQRAQDIFRWKTEAERAIKAISHEIVLLEVQRQRLKGASSVLMLPDAIAKECIELRTNRFEPDLVRDMAEEELIKELSLVGEIRAQFMKTLMDIEQQMVANKAAKARIEYDWSDKCVAYNTDSLNISLNNKSTIILFRPGATRFPENCSTPEYWEHFTRENIDYSESVRQRSADLRGTLDAILINAGRDLRTQADRTNVALAETIACTEEIRIRLEEELRNVLQRIADTELLILDLKDAVRKMDIVMKVAQTRLDNRNYGRPNVENCRDPPQYGLIEEVKSVADGVTALLGQIRTAEAVRAILLKTRGDLEKEIAVKRKSLNIDRDRCGMIRSHYPSASQLAGN